ncbi:MAG: TIGR03088 family PEP-CTERM/XrtA system glycosyltransferase [Gammaproteobacteria bacterium]|nr:MAG: TIGR03088 family PEP-CTERM/XrtA system glycosyltransferase [Gammaproteobacteria bacterium]
MLHVIYRLDVGGLENGLVNLVNHLPPARFRHTLVCLTEATDFRRRIRRGDVEILELHKRPGHDPALYRNLYRLFRRCRPDIVHTRNLAALEAQVPAALARVPVRIHGEHGWDVADLDGMRYRRWKRMLRPFVHHYIALSRQIERYLREEIGVPAHRLTRILNGVDTARFRPLDPARDREDPRPEGFREDTFCIGMVGRLEAVKHPQLLLEAFVRLVHSGSRTGERARLVVVGEGRLRPELEARARERGIADRVWFTGRRDDVPALMRRFDLFVLPSRAEGISNTLMEAMASGVPVVATDVGGNAELVVPGTGRLVPPGDAGTLASVMQAYLEDTERCRREAAAARRRAEQAFGLPAMVERYRQVYETQHARRGRRDPVADPGLGRQEVR